MGFQQSSSDACIYSAKEGELFIIAVYVDDIVLAGRSAEWMTEIKNMLSRRFDVKDMGSLHYFLGGIKMVVKTNTRNQWVTSRIHYYLWRQPVCDVNCKESTTIPWSYKHIGIKHHYTWDLINSGEIRLEYCRTEDMVADMLTKAISQVRLNRLKQVCGMRVLRLSEEC